VTLLNLKAPVVSFDVTTILGREHHSAEEGEHIELSCFQEEAADQASIQQYHVLSNCLAEYSKYGQKPLSIPTAILSPQTSPVAQPSLVAPESPLLQESTSGKTSNILNMLRKAATIAPPVNVEDLIGTEVQVSSPSQSTATASLETSTVNTASSTPHQGMKKIDSKMLFSGTKSSVTSASSPVPIPTVKSATADLPDFLPIAPKSAPVNQLLRSTIGYGDGQTPVDVISSLFTPVPPTAVLQSSKPIAQAVASPPAPAPSTLPTPKLVEEKKAPIPVVPELKAPSLHVPEQDVPLVSTPNVPLLSIPPVLKQSSDTESQMLAMLASIQHDLKALQAANNKKEQPQSKSNELAALKEEILKEVRAQHTKIANQTAQAVKSYIDVENKKIMDALQISKQDVSSLLWRYFPQTNLCFVLVLLFILSAHCSCHGACQQQGPSIGRPEAQRVDKRCHQRNGQDHISRVFPQCVRKFIVACFPSWYRSFVCSSECVV
jgi:hypothetical protein